LVSQPAGGRAGGQSYHRVLGSNAGVCRRAEVVPDRPVAYCLCGCGVEGAENAAVENAGEITRGNPPEE